MNSIRTTPAALAPAAALLAGPASADAHLARADSPPRVRQAGHEPGDLPGGMAVLHGPLAACRAFLRRLADRARLRQLDARLARDLGLPERGAAGAPFEAFLVDPRPLWGIGLTPMPVAAARPSRHVQPHDVWSRTAAAGHARRRQPHQAGP
jgi:hypothetical protein